MIRPGHARLLEFEKKDSTVKLDNKELFGRPEIVP